MRRVEMAQIEELASLTHMLRDASGTTEPAEMLSILGPWFRRMNRSDFFVSLSRRNLPEGQYKITRVIRAEDDPEFSQSSRVNPWRDWTKIPAHTGGLLGDIISSEEPQLLLDLDIDDDPVLGVAIRDMRSLLAIPSYDKGEALNWALFFRRSPDGWPNFELPRIMQDTNILGLATKSLVDRKRADEANARLTQQLEQVASIQQSLLPARVPEVEGLEIATSYLTSDQAGGDYYDFFPHPDGRLGILIADVAGHGPAAATVMAMLRAILHCYEPQGTHASGADDMGPADIIAFANQHLAASGLEGTFVTAFFAFLDPATGELSYTSAGHNPPRIRRACGNIEPLDGAGTVPLGVLDDLEAETASAKLEPGDTLVLYTDGITEAFAPIDAAGQREMFGLDRLDGSLSGCGVAPSAVIDSILANLLRHVGSMTRDDDQTLVVVQRAP